jgi:hypothetical protein
METLAQFLIEHFWLVLLLFGIILSAILIGGFIYEGRKELRENYDTKYKILKLAVLYCEINAVNFQKIKDRFAELEKFGCRDKERIDVLQGQFEARFTQFFEK